MFSVNTNLGAIAALQSLASTQAQLSTTQSRISTGQRVSNAADNPAVYAIAQSMQGSIAGLTAVSDGLSFAAQVVGTASSATSSISSTLNTLKQTLTQDQQQGLSAASMQASINGAIDQVNTFAQSATFNGVNLVAGTSGNGVDSTQLRVLTNTRGDQFTVGGSQGSALNATASGLGIDQLTASSQALQIGLGAITSTTAIVGAGGSGTSTTVSVQTQSWKAAGTTTTGTAGNPAQKWVFVFDDGSATSTNIDSVLNAAGTTTSASTSLAGNTLGTTAGGTNQVTFVDDPLASSTGGIALAKNADGSVTTNASINDLGNGNTEYSFVDAADANGNPTQQTNVVRVNIKGLTTAAAALGSTTTSANQADITKAIGKLTAVMQQVGFSATVDTSNNLLIAGNDVDTRDSSASGTAVVSNMVNTTSVKQVTDSRAAIANIDAAITKLGAISSSLGTATNHITGMQTFTTTLSQALTAGVGALTDADLATESAKLQSLQTKQQLGIQSLSIANQQPQALLKLFG